MHGDLEWHSNSVAETLVWGYTLGRALQRGDVVLLLGSFGAGKTHLVKGIASAWGVDPADVTSPSYVLINEYTADRAHQRLPLYHADLYRVEGTAELASVGLETALEGDGITLVEWAEHGGGLLPPEHLAIHVTLVSDTQRLLRLVPHGRRYDALVAHLRSYPSHDAASD